MCAKFGSGPTVMSKKKGGTDRQTDKGKLQLYIVDTVMGSCCNWLLCWRPTMVLGCINHIYILAGYPASLGPLPPGGLKQLLIFSAVHIILTPKTATPPLTGV